MKKFLAVFIFILTGLFGISEAKMIYSQPYTRVHAGHILVKNESEAIDLKSRISNGESFESLARKYSMCPSSRNGGDLGYFERNQMVKPFENSAFNTPVGEISDPVETEFGWHLIKVYDKK